LEKAVKYGRKYVQALASEFPAQNPFLINRERLKLEELEGQII